MYLDELLSDTFFLLFIVILSIFFIFIGWKNYRQPRIKMISPLARFLLHKTIKKNEKGQILDNEIIKKIIRIDAIFAIITGVSILVIIFIVFIVVFVLHL